MVFLPQWLLLSTGLCTASTSQQCRITVSTHTHTHTSSLIRRHYKHFCTREWVPDGYERCSCCCCCCCCCQIFKVLKLFHFHNPSSLNFAHTAFRRRQNVLGRMCRSLYVLCISTVAVVVMTSHGRLYQHTHSHAHVTVEVLIRSRLHVQSIVQLYSLFSQLRQSIVFLPPFSSMAIRYLTMVFRAADVSRASK